jgi:hypothetical protein
MGQKNVLTCDVCGKIKDKAELTHEVVVAKKGGTRLEKPEVCEKCAKAIVAVIKARSGETTPAPKKPAAPAAPPATHP